MLHHGKILGAAAKQNLPNYREYYEARHFYAFSPGEQVQIDWGNHKFPLGSDLILRDRQNPSFLVGVEICEDLWAPKQPSTELALKGATLLLNLCASSSQIGKNNDRSALCNVQSRRCIAAYLFAAAGTGESSTDLAWDGQLGAWEMGELLGKSLRNSDKAEHLFVDIDVDRIYQERLRCKTFGENASQVETNSLHIVDIERPPHREKKQQSTIRKISRFPFLPNNRQALRKDCDEAYAIQAYGLKQRLRTTNIRKTVIGVSGGLDSTQALNVIVKVMDDLGLPRDHILAATLPGFATGDQTANNALRLIKGFGCTHIPIDIRPAATQMLKDLNHPFARGEKIYDTLFENVQAGLRSAYLFRLANQHGALEVGTGDLSELALGWCTYGVGDQMSHYNVNSGAPKTLIQYLIAHIAQENDWGMKYPIACMIYCIRRFRLNLYQPKTVKSSQHSP